MQLKSGMKSGSRRSPDEDQKVVDHRRDSGKVWPSWRIQPTLVAVYPSAKLGNVTEARLPERFGKTLPKVGRR